jgi:hypothetical protein
VHAFFFFTTVLLLTLLSCIALLLMSHSNNNNHHQMLCAYAHAAAEKFKGSRRPPPLWSVTLSRRNFDFFWVSLSDRIDTYRVYTANVRRAGVTSQWLYYCAVGDQGAL